MNKVTVVDAPDYKLNLTITPLVNSSLNEIIFTREYFYEGVVSNSSNFTLYLEQDGISKIINALQTTKNPTWSLANDDHR